MQTVRLLRLRVAWQSTDVQTTVEQHQAIEQPAGIPGERTRSLLTIDTRNDSYLDLNVREHIVSADFNETPQTGMSGAKIKRDRP